MTARGGGPKVLWLMLGNVPTDEIAASILGAAESIGRLLDDPSIQVVQVAVRASPSLDAIAPLD